MKSYFGISHLDYPNDPDGYINALGKREIWPLIGLFIPISTMLLTRDFDITWIKGDSPPLWYGAILAVSGFGFTFFYPWAMNLMERLRKKLNANADAGLSELIYEIYEKNTDELWDTYYLTKYVGGVTIFLKTTTMGWGISSIIYFAIGRK